MSEQYTPKPTYHYCVICGERLYGEIVGGKMRRGGTRCAHKACWEAEQAENKRRSKKCD